MVVKFVSCSSSPPPPHAEIAQSNERAKARRSDVVVFMSATIRGQLRSAIALWCDVQTYRVLVLALMVSGAQAREVCRWSASGGPEPHLIAGFVGAGAVTFATGSQLAGVVAVNIAGAYKERLDRKRGGWCSGKDLVSNLIGSAAGAYTAGQLLLWQSERGTTMVGYSVRW